MMLLLMLIAYVYEILDKLHIFLRIDQIGKTLDKYRLKQKKAISGKGVTIHYSTNLRNPDGLILGINLM